MKQRMIGILMLMCGFLCLMILTTIVSNKNQEAVILPCVDNAGNEIIGQSCVGQEPYTELENISIGILTCIGLIGFLFGITKIIFNDKIIFNK